MDVAQTHAAWMTASDRTATDARRERRLAHAAKRGSQAALNDLIERHWADAFRAAVVVTRDDALAEDVAQEAFLAAIRGLPRFDPRRRFRPWLHRIVVNRAIDEIRRRPEAVSLDGELQGDVAEAHSPDPAAEALPPDLAAAVGALDPEARAILVLRHLLGYTSAEIGEMLGRPAGTVRRQLADSIDSLRRDLEEVRNGRA